MTQGTLFTKSQGYVVAGSTRVQHDDSDAASNWQWVRLQN